MLQSFSQIDPIAVIPQQTLQQRTETQWSELARLRQSFHLTDEEEKSEVEKDWEHLAQQWRKQRVGLNSRCVQFFKRSCSRQKVFSIQDLLDILVQQNLGRK